MPSAHNVHGHTPGVGGGAALVNDQLYGAAIALPATSFAVTTVAV